MTESIPVLKHHQWHDLLKEFKAAHPRAVDVPDHSLESLLMTVASVAWWLAEFAPEVVQRAKQKGSLSVLLPGAAIETFDTGRWLSILPWMLGMPSLKTQVYLVGDELDSRNMFSEKSTRVDMATLEQAWATPVAHAVSDCQPAAIFNGLLRDWRAGVGRHVEVDACIMFSPGLMQHHVSWMTETDLVALLRSEIPLGFFGYSSVDCLEDQAVLEMYGIEFDTAIPMENPWCGGAFARDYVGSMAGMGWRCWPGDVPDVVKLDKRAFRELSSLLRMVSEEYLSGGGDAYLETLGMRVEGVRGSKSDTEDAVILLPGSLALMESCRVLVRVVNASGEATKPSSRWVLSPFDPPVIAPEGLLEERPDNDDVMARILWAIRTYRDWAGPMQALAEINIPPLCMFDEEEITEAVGGAFREALGIEMDPKVVFNEVRRSGGTRGESAPRWYKAFDSMGWNPERRDKSRGRHSAAFFLPRRDRSMSVPAVCESYFYVPGDDEDDLANEAMSVVSERYPEGAVLLFGTMLFCEVEGRNYQFGGMLWWEGEWASFALMTTMRSIDDVIAQVEGGFRLGDDDERYADDDLNIMEMVMQTLDEGRPGWF